MSTNAAAAAAAAVAVHDAPPLPLLSPSTPLPLPLLLLPTVVVGGGDDDGDEYIRFRIDGTRRLYQPGLDSNCDGAQHSTISYSIYYTIDTNITSGDHEFYGGDRDEDEDGTATEAAKAAEAKEKKSSHDQSFTDFFEL